MRKIILIPFLILFAFANETNATKDKNSSKNDSAKLQEQIKKQIEKEKKYQKEQKFYMGDDYNLTEHEVDQKTVDKVPVIEPEYDFDITDLYAD
jgi:hypothetical protein